MLAGAVAVCGAEDDPQLQSVLLEPTGEVVAINRWAIFVAGPVPQNVISSLPITGSLLRGPVSISRVQLELLVKAIPTDKQFKTLLEHVDVSNAQEGENVCQAVFNDGRGVQKRVLRALALNPNLTGWRKRFIDLGPALSNDNAGHFVYNRARLKAVVDAIGVSCKYPGDFDFIDQRGFAHGYIWRAFNGQTGQVVVIAWVCSTSRTEITAWERTTLFAPAVPLRAPLLRPHKH